MQTAATHPRAAFCPSNENVPELINMLKYIYVYHTMYILKKYVKEINGTKCRAMFYLCPLYTGVYIGRCRLLTHSLLSPRRPHCPQWQLKCAGSTVNGAFFGRYLAFESKCKCH